MSVPPYDIERGQLVSNVRCSILCMLGKWKRGVSGYTQELNINFDTWKKSLILFGEKKIQFLIILCAGLYESCGSHVFLTMTLPNTCTNEIPWKRKRKKKSAMAIMFWETASASTNFFWIHIYLGISNQISTKLFLAYQADYFSIVPGLVLLQRQEIPQYLPCLSSKPSFILLDVIRQLAGIVRERDYFQLLSRRAPGCHMLLL